MRKGYLFALLAAFACAIVLAVPFFKAQILLVLMLGSIIAVAMAWAAQNIFMKYVYIVLFSLFFPIALMEGYYFVALSKNDNHFEHTVNNTDNETVKPLSAYLKDNEPFEVRARRLINGSEVLYDVVYSINDAGLRVTPTHADAKIAIAFLGCSFTFGDGLNDAQTFPWQVGEKLGAQYQVFNFGKSGFGANSVFANLQENMQLLQKYEHVIFFYTIIEDHQRRVVLGPRYVLENGVAVRKGDNEPQKLFGSNESLEKWVKRSYLFKKIDVPLKAMFSPMGNEKDRVDLTYALIESMQKEILQKFPESSFTVVAWPPGAMEMLADLPKNITLIDAEPWLPEYALEHNKKDSKYVLRPAVDSHPTAYANSLVSDALVKLILEKSKNFTQ